MQQRYPRLADVIAAIEKTGRTRAEIGRMAGRDGSQTTRWATGASLPSYQSAKRLADVIRPEHPALADELLDTWHYYSDPAEPAPGSLISPALLAAIRKELPDPADQERVIAALERTMRGDPPPSAQAEADEPRGASAAS